VRASRGRKVKRSLPAKQAAAAQRAGDGILSCPVCALPLNRDGGRFTCSNRHVFDVAKEGYVNLLLAEHRHSKDPGYNKEMIAARRDFFDRRHYERLADDMAENITGYLPPGPAVILDAGCGEGYYLRRIRRHLTGAGQAGRTALCGLDISKHGVRVAARRDTEGLYAVAGTFRMPVLPGRIDVLLAHFSPVSAADFRRVVRPGGIVLVGGPGEDHLYSFKELLYDSPARFEPSESLTRADGFEPVTTHRIRYKLQLRGAGQVANLLAMTPFYWTADQDMQARLAAVEELDTEVDVILHAYRRVAGDSKPWVQYGLVRRPPDRHRRSRRTKKCHGGETDLADTAVRQPENPQVKQDQHVT
jgi:23S rRNA (guanine745-N1)-methyltransferase